MDFFGDSEIYERSYTEALEANKDTVNRINSFRKELDGVRTHLREIQKHLRVNVIVPFSRKAMIRGQLVHTNEVYANLGGRWFLKTSCERALEISRRMMERCDHNIRQWERETELLTSNLQVLDETCAFANGPLKDIVEPYDLAYETSWREQHKERLREHRKRELANKSTDEHLFERLEQLEIEEAVTRTRDEIVPIDECSGLIHESTKNLAGLRDAESVPLCDEKTEKVSSLAENLTVCAKTSENWQETSVIHFKHSCRIRKALQRTENGNIISPNDLYERFLPKLSVPSSTMKSLKPCLTANRGKEERGIVIGDIVERKFEE